MGTLMKDKMLKNKQNQPDEKQPSHYKEEDRSSRFQWNPGDITIIKEEKPSPIKKGK
jgi:hypothetical protein